MTKRGLKPFFNFDSNFSKLLKLYLLLGENANCSKNWYAGLLVYFQKNGLTKKPKNSHFVQNGKINSKNKCFGKKNQAFFSSFTLLKAEKTIE